ncbi:MAG: DEAD/DEAH box helicase, partial [Terriglobales bacterium]
PVQAAALPPALAGQDVLATAQTGTGKTLAFLLPILQRLLPSEGAARPHGLQALILTPTRELAMQIVGQYDLLRPRALPSPALLVGGMNERPQLASLPPRGSARVVVATPGRLEDFLERKLVALSGISVLVLDEADRMLDIGFLPAIRRIVAALPRERQTLCFSATMPAEVEQLARASMRNPERLTLGSTSKPAPSIQLDAYELADGQKPNQLEDLLRQERGRCLVFARTKHGADRLAKTLNRDGFTAAVIHGNRSQAQRTKALSGFQGGEFQILVATDVASRGIHVDDIAHVINYDLPEVADDFVHRVGRTGRAGGSGRASTFVHHAQRADLQRMEKQLGWRVRPRSPCGAVPRHLLPWSLQLVARSAGFDSRQGPPAGAQGSSKLPRNAFTWLRRQSYNSLMKRASITEAKNKLSALIAGLASGDGVLILDRGVPVARLEPVGPGELTDDEARAKLIREGIVRPARKRLDKSWFEDVPATGKDAGLTRALLEERREGR